MTATGVVLRPVGADDAHFLWELANDAEVRRWSFSSRAISWSEHLQWLDGVLADPRRHAFVAELDGSAVGQVRLDERPPDEVALSVSIAADRRGQGLAVSLVSSGVEQARSLTPQIGRVTAEIKPTNRRSIRTFEAAGFVLYRRLADRVVYQRANDPAASSAGRAE